MQDALTSLWTVAALAWLRIFQFPNVAVYGPRTLLVFAGVMVLVFLVVQAWQWAASREESGKGHAGWWLVALGLLMLPFASAPFWLIDLPVSLAFPANRFTLPSMFPVGLVVGGLLCAIAALMSYAIRATPTPAVGREPAGAVS